MLVSGIAAACSAGRSAGPDAGTSTGEADDDAACETVTDAYGFEVERCDDPTGPVTLSRTDLVLLIPSVEVQEAVGDVLRALSPAAGACDSFESWADSMTTASDALRDATTLARSSPVLDNWTGDPEAGALAATVEESFLLTPECAAPTDDLAAATAITGSVSGALDGWRSATAPGHRGLGSALWANSDQMGHSRMVQQVLAETERIDLLIVGDSATKRGFDPIRLGDDLGEVAVVTGIDGVLPAQYELWLEDLAGIGARPERVVFSITPWTAAVPCGDLRPPIHVATSEARSAAFADIDAVAGTDPSTRILGGTSDTYRSPLLDTYSDLFVDDGRGLYAGPQAPSSDGLARQQDVYRALFADVSACEEWIDGLGAALDAVVADGRDAVVVAMPVSAALAAVHPDGRDGLRGLIDPFEAAAVERGVPFLDFTDLLADADFADLTHPDESGRDRLTERLRDELSAR